MSEYKDGETVRLRKKLLAQTAGPPWSEWSARLINLVGDIEYLRRGLLGSALSTGLSPMVLTNEIFQYTSNTREAIDLLWARVGGDS